MKRWPPLNRPKPMEQLGCPRCGATNAGQSVTVKSVAGMNERWESHDRQAAGLRRPDAPPADHSWEAGDDDNLRHLLARPGCPSGFWLSSSPSTGMVVALGVWFVVSFFVATTLVDDKGARAITLWATLFALGFVPTALVFRESVRARFRRAALDHWDEYQYCAKDNVVFVPGGTAASTPQEFFKISGGNPGRGRFALACGLLLFRAGANINNPLLMTLLTWRSPSVVDEKDPAP